MVFSEIPFFRATFATELLGSSASAKIRMILSMLYLLGLIISYLLLNYIIYHNLISVHIWDSTPKEIKDRRGEGREYLKVFFESLEELEKMGAGGIIK